MALAGGRFRLTPWATEGQTVSCVSTALLHRRGSNHGCFSAGFDQMIRRCSTTDGDALSACVVASFVVPVLVEHHAVLLHRRVVWRVNRRCYRHSHALEEVRHPLNAAMQEGVVPRSRRPRPSVPRRASASAASCRWLPRRSESFAVPRVRRHEERFDPGERLLHVGARLARPPHERLGIFSCVMSSRLGAARVPPTGRLELVSARCIHPRATCRPAGGSATRSGAGHTLMHYEIESRNSIASCCSGVASSTSRTGNSSKIEHRCPYGDVLHDHGGVVGFADDETALAVKPIDPFAELDTWLPLAKELQPALLGGFPSASEPPSRNVYVITNFMTLPPSADSVSGCSAASVLKSTDTAGARQICRPRAPGPRTEHRTERSTHRGHTSGAERHHPRALRLTRWPAADLCGVVRCEASAERAICAGAAKLGPAHLGGARWMNGSHNADVAA